jgi:LysR family transcriptional regulator, glycine cleavage system transcriptional activator
MKFNSPSLPELHAFLTVCHLGSFSHAAQALFVTQAAVSRAVMRLEARLKCNLFHRTAAGVVPTEKGLAFQALVEAHVAGLETATALFFQSMKASPFNEKAKTKLRLSVIPTLGTRWLMPRLPEFQSLHPHVSVELRQFYHDEKYTREDVDVWIDVKRAKPWPRSFKRTYLLGKEFTPACTPEIAKRLKKVDDLLSESLLHHTNFPDNWAVWFRSAGLSDAKGVRQMTLGPGFDLGSNLIVAASAGMGVTVIQPCLIERELASGELVLPFKQTVARVRGYYALCQTSQAQNEVVMAFVGWLQTQVSKATPFWE